MSNITINLSDIYESLPNQEWSGRGRRAHNDTPSIHHNLALELTRTIWASVRHNADSAYDEWADGWTCQNYFISGERGCGKSTFLRYVSKCLACELKSMPSSLTTEFTGRIPNICNLFFCDPTAMHSNESFFVDIIAAFERRFCGPTPVHTSPIRLSIDGGRHTHENHDGSHSHSIYINTSSTEIREKIRDLARGVKLMLEKDSSGNLDPVTLLREGILNSTCALHLKQEFDNLVNAIAENYHIDAFLICIDDADIESMKNTDILEDIRSYLTHPRLIILFTGDTTLTNEIIRKKQFNQFGREFHREDFPNQTKRWELVGNLTAQYLKKIFPVSNHYALPSLYDLVQLNRRGKYLVVFPRKIEDMPCRFDIKAFITNIFLSSIVAKESDAKPLMKGFLRLPARSIMHTLRRWNDRNILAYLDDKASEDMPVFREKDRHELADIIYQSFRSAFFSELLCHGFTRDDLEARPSVLQTCWGVLQHSARNKDRRHSHHLATFSTHANQQESALFLTAKVASAARGLRDALSYSIYAIFTVQAYRFFQRLDTIRPTDESKYDAFVHYLHTHAPGNPFHWTRKLSLVFISQRLEGNQGKRGKLYFSHGVVLFENEGDILTLDSLLKEMADELNSMTGENPEEEKTRLKAYLLLIISLGRVENRRNSYYFSPYHLLGFIQKCLDIIREDEQGGDSTDDACIPMINFLCQTLHSFIAETTTPVWEQSIGSQPYIIGKQAPETSRIDGKDNCLRDRIEELARDILAWYPKAEEFGQLNAKDLAEIADSIYHHICQTGNSIESQLSEINSGDSEFCLFELFNMIKLHLSPHTFFYEGGTTPAFKKQMIEKICSFPLIHTLSPKTSSTKDKAVSTPAAESGEATTSPEAESGEASGTNNTGRGLIPDIIEEWERHRTNAQQSADNFLSFHKSLLQYNEAQSNLSRRIQEYESIIMEQFKAPNLASLGGTELTNLSIPHDRETTYNSVRIVHDKLTEYENEVKELAELSDSLSELIQDHQVYSPKHPRQASLYSIHNERIKSIKNELETRKDNFRGELRKLLGINIERTWVNLKYSYTKSIEPFVAVFKALSNDIIANVYTVGSLSDIMKNAPRVQNTILYYSNYMMACVHLESCSNGIKSFLNKLLKHPDMSSLFDQLEYDATEYLKLSGDNIDKSLSELDPATDNKIKQSKEIINNKFAEFSDSIKTRIKTSLEYLINDITNSNNKQKLLPIFDDEITEDKRSALKKLDDYERKFSEFERLFSCSNDATDGYEQERNWLPIDFATDFHVHDYIKLVYDTIDKTRQKILNGHTTNTLPTPEP